MSSFNYTQRKPAKSMLRRNVPRLYVQSIFALAAALALSTSACGKKDEGATPVQTAAVAPPSPPAASTDAVGNVTGTTPDSGAKQDPATGRVREKRGEGKGAQKEGEPDPMESLFHRDEPKGPPAETLDSAIYYDPNGLTPDQIFNRKGEVKQAGTFIGETVRSDVISESGETLVYSGSSVDTLRDHLYTLVNLRGDQVDEATRTADREFAQSIQLASFNVDWSSRNAELNFKFDRKEKGGKYVTTLATISGQIDNVAKFHLRSHAMKIEADVACMDISGGCKTVHIRVKDRSTGKVRVAHLIARHTNATLYIEGQLPGIARNAEYDRFMGILLNTEREPRGPNVVEKLTLTTSETIGGASNFAITMGMRFQDQWGRTGGDTVQLTGPLVQSHAVRTKERENDRIVALNVSPTFTVINEQIVPTTAIGTEDRIVDMIQEAHLIKNDGSGNLQVELTIRKATVDAQIDRILLTVARIHTPTSSIRIPMR